MFNRRQFISAIIGAAVFGTVKSTNIAPTERCVRLTCIKPSATVSRYYCCGGIEPMFKLSGRPMRYVDFMSKCTRVV